MIPPAQLRGPWGALTCALLAVASNAPAVAAPGPAPPVRAAAPPGFEAVDVGLTWVDVYWAGMALGQFEARYMGTRITFTDPDAVVDALPGLINRARVRDALTGPLHGHSERLCGASPPPGCGRLAPSVAAVLFDPTRFRVDVFVSSLYFSSRRGARPVYLDAPDTGGSFLAHLRGAVAGAPGTPARLRLVGDAVLAYDAGRVQATLSHTPYDGPRLDSLTAEHDRRGVHLAAGLFDVHHGRFMRLPRLVGLVVSTPLDTLYDARQDTGTPIVVFLDRPSRVTLSRDGRLLTGGHYDRGLRELDTRALPYGAYTVDVEIREEGGVTRHERHPFVKSLALPPRSHPWWYAAAGALVGPGAPRPVVRAETLHRTPSGLGLGGGLTLRTDIALAEASAVLVGPGWEVRGTAFTSTDLDVGADLVATLRAGRLHASARLGHVRRGGAGRRGPLLPLAGTQASGSLGAGLGRFDITLRGRWQRLGESDHHALAASARWTLLRGAHVDLSWAADAEWTGAGLAASSFLRLALRTEHLRASTVGGAVSSPDRPAPWANGRVDVAFDDGRWLSDEVRADASLARVDRTTTAHAGATYRGVLGELGAAVDHRAAPGGTARTIYSGDFALSVAVTRDGPVFGGRRSGGTAALVVHARGPRARLGADARLRLVVKDQLGGSVAGGERVLAVGERRVLHLRPFRRYEVVMTPAESAMVDVDASPRFVTLYPGNVARLTWDVAPLLVVYGRALRPDGSILAGAAVLGEGSTTDPAGWFQVEVGRDRALELRLDGATCRIPLTGRGAEDGVLALGDVVCR